MRFLLLLLIPVILDAQELQLRRELTIGETEGPPELEFSRVSAVATDGDGRLFVVNNGSASIRVFTKEGKFVREFGRRGRGPGEYENIRSFRLWGDTAMIVDASLRRVTLMDRNGKVHRSWPTGGSSPFGVHVLPLARAAGGWLALRAEFIRGAFPKAGEASRDSTHVVYTLDPSVGAGLAYARTISYPNPRSFGISYGSGLTANSPLFEPTPVHAVDQHGRVYLTRPPGYRIDVYDHKGQLVRSVSRQHTPKPVTRALVAAVERNLKAYYDTTRAAHSEWDIQRAADEGRLKLPTGSQIPALARMLVSAEGSILVERPDLAPDPISQYKQPPAPPQPSIYDRFDPAGRFLGSVRFASNFRALALTETAVIGVERDEFDVERVVRFAFARR